MAEAASVGIVETPPPAGQADASAIQAAQPRPRGGYLHIGPDWRITFAHLEGGRTTDSTGAALAGRVLWEIYPDILGSPFEKHYRATMADRKPRTFQADYGPAGMRLENRLFPSGDGLALFYEDVTARRLLESQLQRRNRQQEAVARLGQAALEGLDVASLLDLAVREVAKALDVEFAKFVEPIGDGATLRLRAGVGWRRGLVGTATMPADASSQAGFALAAHATVVVKDLPHDARFAAPLLLLDHGVVSGLSVLVGPRATPLGVLGAHTAQPRDFTQDDLNFMQAVANLLGAAIARNRIELELRRHRDDLEGLVHEHTARLEASNRELEAFSYTVSHDLRTPLRAIDGFSRLLVQHYGPSLPEPARGLLERVRDGAQRMGHLIESLLSLARIGRREMVLSDVDVSAMAQQVLDELAMREPRRRVTVDVHAGLVARGDPDLVRIVLENLLGNAWKFTSGRAKARIEVAGEAGSDRPIVVVRDNGAGFDLAHASRLFEPFQRMHGAGEFEGTGVGLATVQRVVQRHGGHVWAEAQPGAGATFRFTLAPSAIAPVPVPPSPAEAPKAPGTAVPVARPA